MVYPLSLVFLLARLPCPCCTSILTFILQTRPRSALLDGYVAAVFDIQDAFQYWNFFLDHSEHSQPQAYRVQSDGIAYPSVSSEFPLILDHKVMISRGSVVPAQFRRFLGSHRVPLKQQLPGGRSEDHPWPRLRPPVFFRNATTGELGISVGAALNGSALREMADLDKLVEISDKQFVIFEVDVRISVRWVIRTENDRFCGTVAGLPQWTEIHRRETVQPQGEAIRYHDALGYPGRRGRGR